MGGSNSSGASELADDMRFFGMEDEADEFAKRPVPTYEVWPENIEVVNLFCSVASQWDFVLEMGTVLHRGLNYSKVKSALELMGIKRKRWPALFHGLQVMEQAALTVYRERES